MRIIFFSIYFVSVLTSCSEQSVCSDIKWVVSRAGTSDGREDPAAKPHPSIQVTGQINIIIDAAIILSFFISNFTNHA